MAENNEKRIKKQMLRDFFAVYGEDNSAGEVLLIASPARINVIGEHVDNYGGNVFPAAIDKYLYLAIRARKDSKIVYNDLRFPGIYSFDINDTFAYKPENDYTNYLNGILQTLKNSGTSFSHGFEILMFSCIPAGGGISSSAALEVGFAYAVSELYGLGLDRITLAKLGQRSEHDFMNVKCGIMDQFAVAMGKKDYAIDLDCATLKYEYIPLELGDYRIIVMNTNKKRRLAESEYNARLDDCNRALAVLQRSMSADRQPLTALCELTLDEFEKYSSCLTDPVLYRRALHVISENDREKRACAALKKGDLKLLGKLVQQSHESLRSNYEVTGIELDTLADEANKHESCIGSRMIGAGFGGCAIAFVHKDAVSAFIQTVQDAYTKKIGYSASFFECTCGDGTYRM